MAASRTTEMPPLPGNFVDSLSWLGPESVEALTRTLDMAPSVSYRLNKRKPVAPEFDGATPVDWCPSGFHLDSRPDFNHEPLLHAGAFYVQEAASMVYESIVATLLPQLSNGNPVILDACAAPGGKTTAILNALSGDYTLVANEFDRKRAFILKENLEKWGDPQIILTNAPTSAFTGMENSFDIIAVDAPCSGEGMMRREPVARTQWSPGLVDSCATLQREILSDLLPALRPCGFLIYSTCTFNRTENEENVEYLTNELRLLPVAPSRRFMPHECQCEGLFVAVMQKPGDFEDLPRKYKVPTPPKNINLKDIKFIVGEDWLYEEIGNSLHAFPASTAPMLRDLRKHKIRLIGGGVELATRKGTTLVPSSRQALSYAFSDTLPAVEVDRETALEYLRRNPLALPAGTPRGMVAIKYRNLPIGLVKNIGSRANNLYPSEWKIR